MARTRVRLIKVEPVEQGGAWAAFVSMFDVYAQIEQEGAAFAGCIEGFSGSMESVGETEEEVIQGLCDAFALTVDYHSERKTLNEFLERNNIRHTHFDGVKSFAAPETFEKEVTYLVPRPAVAGGLLACAVG